MAQTKPYLTHLFTAHFEDGFELSQTQEDISMREPDKRSAYFDVLQEIEEGRKLETFSITDGSHTYSVDLRTGVFSINGAQFGLQDQFFVAMEPLQLEYFRDTRVDSTVEVRKDPTGNSDEALLGDEIGRDHYVSAYYMGWRTKNNKGEEVKKLISFI